MIANKPLANITLFIRKTPFSIVLTQSRYHFGVIAVFTTETK